ncbi:ABC transporter ATP-binding protein [Falsirhodobacter algicola]|uniref:ATP-binding cassette domain-containing protein n=1 Tax=Falsirhodobacter algicola TaxID=2692330 RepID=A0A8J8MUM6_9RHOB|nr:ABC transporter ATP-binding protein [Falsirhodobacter algicola]QUS37035.1 ATP-binding cassette domain-containing protein [Falsirhodobacter algicola]
MAGLGFSGVRRSYDGVPALAGIDAEIADGEFVALLGPSGCGKTTLLRLIAGFEMPDTGTITLGGQVMAGPDRFVPPEDRNIGIVFQSYALWPHMTVAGNVAYPLRVRGVPTAERRRRVAEALDLTGLSALADRPPAQLSGGQRQRVALARCLVADPRAVLLDEPLANLDLALRAAMQDAFTAFHRRTGATMVYVTHDQTEALAMADRVAVMQAGTIRQFDTPEGLYDRPRDGFVAGFVGDGAVVALTAAPRPGAGRARVHALGQEIEARCDAGPPTHLCIRPEQVRLDPEGPIRARVSACAYQGGRFRLTLETEGETLIAHSARRALPGEALRLSIGMPWAFADPGAPPVAGLMQPA